MQFDLFRQFSNLHYGISTKHDDSANPRGGTDWRDRQGAIESFLQRKGIEGRVFSPHLVHGTAVVTVTKDTTKSPLEADGCLTMLPSVYLVVTIADCFPVYFYDAKTNTAGIAHCGWRSIVQGLVPSVIRAFIQQAQSRPSDIYIGIGPGLQPCHFTVHDDVINDFADYPEHMTEHKSHYTIDLPGIITQQASVLGIQCIESSNECTYCLNKKYFSRRRRDALSGEPVMVAYIGYE